MKSQSNTIYFKLIDTYDLQRLPFAFQEASFYRAKGHLLEPKRQPFGERGRRNKKCK